MKTSRCSWGAAAEVDAIREQQLKLTKSGHSLAWLHETSAHQRHYHTRMLVHQGRGLGQTHVDVVKEVRPQKHTVYMYVCLQQREIFVRHTVLTRMEVRAPQTSALWRELQALVIINPTSQCVTTVCISWSAGEHQWSSFFQTLISQDQATGFTPQVSCIDFSILGRFFDCTIWTCLLSDYKWL